jgi:hypothetical protein
MKWFGTSWNPGVCVSADKIPTPVGEKCPKCTSHIEEGDQGVVIMHAQVIDFENETCEVVAEAWHLDCFLRLMLPPDYLKRHPNLVRNTGHN